MLQALQNEWDETVLETFNLRQQLDATRKELAHALYQHDAACRVIARLVRERDEAYQLVNAYKAGGGSQGQPSAPAPSAPTSSNAAMEVEGEEEVAKGLNEEVVSELNSVCKSLSSGRKQRKPSEHLQSKDDMMLLEESASYAPHKKAAANALLVRDNSVITAGNLWSFVYTYESHSFYIPYFCLGVDRAVVISDTASGSLQCQLTGHTGAVTSLAAAPGAAGGIFSGSEDKTVRVRLCLCASLYPSNLFNFSSVLDSKQLRWLQRALPLHKTGRGYYGCDLAPLSALPRVQRPGRFLALP